MKDYSLTEYEEDGLADQAKESAKQRASLENQIFVWDGWDDIGTIIFLYYNVELIVPVGEFPVGHKFPSAVFNGEESFVSFMDENKVQHTFELSLSVGKKMETA